MLNKINIYKARNLTIGYLIVLSLIALLSIGAYGLIQLYIHKMTSDAPVINYSGRQRMLSQKLTQEVILLVQTQTKEMREQYCKLLGTTLASWSQVHRGLLHGDEELQLPVNDSQEVRDLFIKMEPYYQILKNSVDSILGLTEKDLNQLSYQSPVVRKIVEASPLYLKWMDHIVFKYDKDAQARVYYLKQFETYIVFIVLLVLLLAGLFVFRPMVTRVQITYRDYQKVTVELRKHREHLEELVEVRTAELKSVNEVLRKEITERKQAEKKIRLYAEIVKRTQIGLIVYQLENINDSKTFRLVSANPAASQATGTAIEDLVGMTMAEAFPSLLATEIPEQYAKVVRSGKEKDLGELLYGDERILETVFSVKAFPLPNNQIGVAFENITERKQAEEALRESEENLRTTLYSIGDAVIVSDVHGNVKRMNPVAEKLTGWKIKEAEGKSLADVFHIVSADTRQTVEDPVQKVIKSGKIVALANHTMLIARDGTEYQIADNGAPIYDANGKISGVVLVFRDVTEEYRMHDNVKKNEARLNEAQRLAQIGSWELDLISNTLYWSDEVYQMFDLEPQQFGANYEAFLDNIHPDDRVFVDKTYTDSVKNKTPYDIVHRLLLKDGTIKFVNERCETFYDDAGKAVRSIGTVQDITERKQTEESLRESEEQYRKIFENVRDVFYQTDYHGAITEISPSIERHSGYTREALIGSQIEDFYFYPNDYLELREKLEENGEVNDFEVRLKDKEGRLIYVSVNAHIVFDIDGKPAATLGVLRNITERKRVEEEKAKLEEQLRRSQKLETIGTLAGGIAHDFNNILTPILGYADMALSDLPSSSSLHEDLEHILKGANRAKDLVEQILLFSKQVEKERKALALHPIVKEALKLLRPSIPTTIEIRQQIDVTCDKVLVDATQMHQVIVNLCTNAWQAMEEKGGVLTIELKQLEVDAASAKMYANLNEQEYVRLTVSDTGLGMDNATVDRIFEPFFTTKPVDKGTGMGLSVVHGIVRSHHGDIFVYSEQGKGSTFHVYLPIAIAEKEISKKKLGAIQGGQEYILVVDDDEEVANVVKKMLKQLGYKVNVFNSSVEALETISQQPNKYDLVISDLTMPTMTGLVLSEQLHKLLPQFPTIIMTGYGENLPEGILKHYGIHEVIGKPIIVRELAGYIRKVLDK